MSDQGSDLESDPSLVTLCRYSYLHEALMAREMLEAEGIDAFLPDEHMASAGTGYASPLGWIRLQVRPDDVERTIEILDLSPEDRA
jgi:hypothetical protein